MLIAPQMRAQGASQAEREAMYTRYLNFASYVRGGTIEPHWMADGSSFWYAEGVPENTIIYKVDPEANTKTPLFNTTRLRQSLTNLLGHELPHGDLPFAEFTFVDDTEKAVEFSVEDQRFTLRLDTGTISRLVSSAEKEQFRKLPRVTLETVEGGWDVMEILSPDKRWFARFKEHNLWIRSAEKDRSVQLTTDGVKDNAWLQGEPGPWALWSPDSKSIAIKKQDIRQVHKILMVHWLKTPVEVEWVFHPESARPGGAMPRTELYVVDVRSKQKVRVDIDRKRDQFIALLAWRQDGSELLLARMSRDYKELELLAADPLDGTVRILLTERDNAAIPFPPFAPVGFIFLDDGHRFIRMSERDGWNRPYLYDLDGRLILRLTRGQFPVISNSGPIQGIMTVDENDGWVYFTAHAEQRLYDTHLYRVNLEGEHFTRLTEGDGQHEISFAPSKKFFLDKHSNSVTPATVTLRRADGKLLQTLSTANVQALNELQWKPPEEFVVKAADGDTDLYGILYKPYDFDPSKKYPIIEHIYAGPSDAVVPRTFTSHHLGVHAQAIAQLGFVTFMVDGRGTSERGKAFNDVAYGNIGRHEIPDHVAALRELAKTRPYMDLERVGIYGYSWGGHFALRALLMAPEVYHVGIAGAPDLDIRGTTSLTERWMGLLENNESGYEFASNLPLAGNLKGKLLLLQGTSDDATEFSNMMKMIDALIQAGKPYDLVLFPEQTHGLATAPGPAGTYFREAIRRYFQEHLNP